MDNTLDTHLPEQDVEFFESITPADGETLYHIKSDLLQYKTPSVGQGRQGSKIISATTEKNQQKPDYKRLLEVKRHKLLKERAPSIRLSKDVQKSFAKNPESDPVVQSRDPFSYLPQSMTSGVDNFSVQDQQFDYEQHFRDVLSKFNIAKDAPTLATPRQESDLTNFETRVSTPYPTNHKDKEAQLQNSIAELKNELKATKLAYQQGFRDLQDALKNKEAETLRLEKRVKELEKKFIDFEQRHLVLSNEYFRQSSKQSNTINTTYKRQLERLDTPSPIRTYERSISPLKTKPLLLNSSFTTSSRRTKNDDRDTNYYLNTDTPSMN